MNSEEPDEHEENIFKHNTYNMPAYQSVDMQNINMNFGVCGPVGDHMQQSTHHSDLLPSTLSGLLSNDTDGRSSSTNSTRGPSSVDDSTPQPLHKGKKSSRGASALSGGRKSKAAVAAAAAAAASSTDITDNSAPSQQGSAALPKAAAAAASKAHSLFASPAALVRGSSLQPSNISPSGADSGGGHCNCKKSKCLKLYCECFAALRYCKNCNCVECHNCPSHEKERQEAVIITKERNSQAFQSKVNDKQGHTAGCNCKKSQCLKKYCECFEGAVFCGENCKCLSCKNYSGSEKLSEMKRHSTERKDKTLSIAPSSVSSSIVLTKELPTPQARPVNNVSLPHPARKGSDHRSVSAFQALASSVKLLPLHTPNEALLEYVSSASAASARGVLATPGAHTPHKKRSRRCGGDLSDMSSETEGHTRKAARSFSGSSFSPASFSTASSSPSSARSGNGSVCGSQSSGSREILQHQQQHGSHSSSGRDLSPSDTLDLLLASPSPQSSPELSFLHSAEKELDTAPGDHCPLSRAPLQLLAPRYPFFGQHHHRATKLTALRCLEFLDNKDLFSMSLVNKLWSQAAMDDALWE